MLYTYIYKRSHFRSNEARGVLADAHIPPTGLQAKIRYLYIHLTWTNAQCAYSHALAVNTLKIAHADRHDRMLRHVTSRHATSCYATLRYATRRDV